MHYQWRLNQCVLESKSRDQLLQNVWSKTNTHKLTYLERNSASKLTRVMTHLLRAHLAKIKIKWNTCCFRKIRFMILIKVYLDLKFLAQRNVLSLYPRISLFFSFYTILRSQWSKIVNHNPVLPKESMQFFFSSSSPATVTDPQCEKRLKTYVYLHFCCLGTSGVQITKL